MDTANDRLRTANGEDAGQNSEHYSRRHFIQVAAATTIGGGLLAACGDSGTSNVKTQGPNTLPPNNATITASVGKTYFPSGDPNVPDAYTAVPPPYKAVQYVPGHGGKVTGFTIGYSTPVLAEGQNKYWQALNKRLGVDWQPNIAFGPDDYAAKLGVVLASGNLPDIFVSLGGTAIDKALSEGAFADLTPYVNDSARKVYPNLNSIGSVVWNNSKENNKIYGVPRPRTIFGNILLYHKEWADQMGIATPTNADEFLAMMKAFSKNGRWGIGGYPGTAFVQNMFNVPYHWRVESNGNLTPTLMTDEFKQSLDFERQMWAAGVYSPDAYSSLTNQQLKTQFEGGKFAAYGDGFSAWLAERGNAKIVDPKADVTVLVPPPAHGGTASHWFSQGYYGTVMIPSSASPSRIKELLAIIDYFTVPNFSEEGTFLTYGIDKWDSTADAKGVRTVTPMGKKEMGDLHAICNPPTVFYTPDEPQYALMVQKIARSLAKIGVSDPTNGLTSPYLKANSSKINANIGDALKDITQGKQPLSYLDTVIKDWLARGESQVIKEYTDAYHKAHS